MNLSDNYSNSKISDNSQNFKIIVIGNDEDHGLPIRKKLQQKGYKTLLVNTGNEALKTVSGKKNEILIVDYMLSDMKGEELIGKLKKKHTDTPVFIIMTEPGDKNIAVEMMKLGAKDYIIKETNYIEILAEKLGRIVEELEKNKENERSKKLLQNTERLAGVGGWLWYAQSDKWIMSDNWMALHGCSKKYFSSNDLLQVAHPEDNEKIKEAFNKTATTGEPYQVEHRIVRQDNGEIRYIKAFGKAEMDDDGNVHLVSGAALDITESKKVEKKLQESEEKFRSIFENSAMGIFRSTPEGRYQDINKAFARILGFDSPKKMLSKVTDISKLYKHPADRENIIKEFADKGFVEDYQVIANHPHKEVVWVSINARQQHHPDGSIYYEGTIQDITERKNAEIQLSDSEQRLKVLFESAPDAIYLHDLKGKFLDGNYAAEKMLGYTRKELIGKIFTKLNLLPAKYLKKAEANLLKNLQGKEIGPDKFELKHRDGSRIPVEIRAFPVTVQNKKMVMGIVRDISQRKKAEVALKLNEKRLESLLRIAQKPTSSTQELLDFALHEAIDLTSSKIGYIYFYDDKKRQFILNTWSKEVMKECKVQDPQTKYNLDDTGCWGEAVRQRRPIIINDYKAGGPLIKGTPDGHVKIKKFLTIPVIIEGEIVAVAGVANKKEDYNDADIRQLSLLMDSVWKISERITLISNLKQAKEKAEESDRLKSAFLANMSHEIRTPMNGILGFTELLKQPDLSGDEKDEFIGVIQKSGDRLLNTVTDLVDISKIEAGLVEVSNTEVDANAELESLYSFFLRESDQKGLKLSLEQLLPENNKTIFTDKTKLLSILTNLIKNAIKYTSKGSVKFGCRLKNNQPEFYVKDTGIGIPQNRKHAIFERFVQADIADTRAYEGSGLGLAISKAYVEMLGGDGNIWLDSEEGKGSEFYFSIPFDTNAEEKKQGKKVKNFSAETNSSNSLENLTLLIAEDDEVSQYYIDTILGNHVAKIYFAKTGKEAVELCKKNPDINLILMDIKMPEMDGYKATREIRKFNKKVPIIAQTAYALAGDSEKALDAGCNDYIAKPINRELLLQIISKMQIFDNQ